MAEITTRKIIHLGHSDVVCLPPSFLEKQGIKPGDSVQVIEGSSSVMIRKAESK